MAGMENNPLLAQEDYMAGYKKSIQQLKDKPDAVLFEKLCYDLFAGSDSGKKFMEIVLEKYLIPPLVDKGSSTYPVSVIWSDGFKDAFRLLRDLVKSHEQRIKAGVNA